MIIVPGFRFKRLNELKFVLIAPFLQDKSVETRDEYRKNKVVSLVFVSDARKGSWEEYNQEYYATTLQVPRIPFRKVDRNVLCCARLGI